MNSVWMPGSGCRVSGKRRVARRGMAFAFRDCVATVYDFCADQSGRSPPAALPTETTMPPEAARRGASPDLAGMTRDVVQAAEEVLHDATRAVRLRVAKDNQTVDRLLDREQRATHALAWLATYVEAVRQ